MLSSHIELAPSVPDLADSSLFLYLPFGSNASCCV